MPFKASGKQLEGKSGIFRTHKSVAKEDKKPANIIKNALNTLNPMTPKVLQGSIIYVALEVAVSKVLRKIMRADTKSYTELAVVHSMSLGFMGGTSVALNNPGSIGTLYSDKRMLKHVKQGAKGIPALFIAQYVYNTFFYGFGLTFFSMKDALIMGAAKILTRPIAAQLYKRAKFVQNGLDAQSSVEQAQMVGSNLARIPAEHGWEGREE